MNKKITIINADVNIEWYEDPAEVIIDIKNVLVWFIDNIQNIVQSIKKSDVLQAVIDNFLSQLEVYKNDEKINKKD